MRCRSFWLVRKAGVRLGLCKRFFLEIAMLLSFVVVDSILTITLVLAVVTEGLPLGVVWCWCLCLVNMIVLVVRDKDS